MFSIIITGVSITALILIVLGIKNRTTIIATWEALKEIAEKTGASTVTISRVNRILNYGNDSLNSVLDKE